MQILKKLINKKFAFFILAVAVLTFFIKQGAYLRWLGYERIPGIGIFDERNYALQGISLRKTGIPIGWSDSGAYEHTPLNKVSNTSIEGLTIKINGQIPSFNNIRNLPTPVYAVEQYDWGLGMQHLKLVLPFLDHPPLGGLITSLGLNKNVDSFLDINAEQFRKPMLTIGIITSLLVFVYAFLLTKNVIVGILSVILINIIPTYLLTSRYALLENVMQPVILAQLIFLLLANRYKKYSSLFFLASGLLAGLGFLVKETGLGFLLSSLALLFIWRESKTNKLLFILSALTPIIFYILWVLWLSPQLFLEVFVFNTSRGFFGPLNFISIFPSLRFAHFPLDGWWMWSFIAILILTLKKPKENLELLLPFFGYLFFLLFLSSANYPWYYFALVPFLIVASAVVIWDMVRSPSFGTIFPFALIPLSTSLYWGNTVFNLPPKIFTYRLVVFGFLAIAVAKIIKPKNAPLKILWIITCVVIFYEVYKWNTFSMLYIIDHWDNLPTLNLF